MHRHMLHLCVENEEQSLFSYYLFIINYTLFCTKNSSNCYINEKYEEKKILIKSRK